MKLRQRGDAAASSPGSGGGGGGGTGGSGGGSSSGYALLPASSAHDDSPNESAPSSSSSSSSTLHSRSSASATSAVPPIAPHRSGALEGSGSHGGGGSGGGGGGTDDESDAESGGREATGGGGGKRQGFTWWDRVQFQTMSGFLEILSDVDKYLLFLGLIRIVGCDFTAMAGVCYSTSTLLQTAWLPLTGLIVDSAVPQLHVIHFCSYLVMAAAQCGMLLVQTPGAFLALYILRWLAHLLASACLWKILKIRAEYEFGANNIEPQERLLNGIGTTGDLTGQVLYIAAMFATYYAAEYVDPSFGLVRWIIFGTAGVMTAVCAGIAAGISREYCTPPGSMPPPTTASAATAASADVLLAAGIHYVRSGLA